MSIYIDNKIENNSFIRIFNDDIDDNELIWHRDYKNRHIKVIENINWKFQFDNQLPFILKNDIFIIKETYHRLLKGDGKLIISISEY